MKKYRIKIELDYYTDGSITAAKDTIKHFMSYLPSVITDQIQSIDIYDYD